MTKPLKLHLGCGGEHLKGYINIDIIKRSGIDMIADARHLPFQEGSAEVIESYHLIEHIPRYEVLPMLKHWHAILIPSGKGIIECPDFDKTCEAYLKGAEGLLSYIFGGQRWPSDTHYFGYNFKRLKKLLEEAGFTQIIEKPAQDYHVKTGPCLRAECQKPK